MQDVANEFIPYPWKGSETYGGYCHRLEEAMIKITALDMPPESAVQALAFIAMEVPSDFDHCSIREVLPSRRMKDFLRRQPEEVRTLFRTEAMKYLPPKKTAWIGSSKCDGGICKERPRVLLAAF